MRQSLPSSNMIVRAPAARGPLAVTQSIAAANYEHKLFMQRHTPAMRTLLAEISSPPLSGSTCAAATAGLHELRKECLCVFVLFSGRMQKPLVKWRSCYSVCRNPALSVALDTPHRASARSTAMLESCCTLTRKSIVSVSLQLISRHAVNQLVLPSAFYRHHKSRNFCLPLYHQTTTHDRGDGARFRDAFPNVTKRSL